MIYTVIVIKAKLNSYSNNKVGIVINIKCDILGVGYTSMFKKNCKRNSTHFLAL